MNLSLYMRYDGDGTIENNFWRIFIDTKTMAIGHTQCLNGSFRIQSL